tara:strand:+ start:1369 stop:1740 length:372 start_codon:yes stop_codon:yes gene_type:complete
MAYNIPFLYFNEGGDDDAAGDSAVYPASALKGSDPASATTTTLYFKPQVVGDALATGDINDKVVVTHTGVKHSVFMRALAKAINNPAKTARDGFIVVADADGATGVGANVGVTAWDAEITYAA